MSATELLRTESTFQQCIHRMYMCMLKLTYLALSKNTKWRPPPYLELLFRNHGPPTNSTSWPEHCVKISFQSPYYFQIYGHLKILQIWLKTPIPVPKIYLLGVLLLNIIFRHRDPKRHLLDRNRVIWAIKRRDRSSGLTGTAREEYKKQRVCLLYTSPSPRD